MSRAADYTIKGFLYQFNKTLLEILHAQDDDIITVEGIIEDVEIVTGSMITAIQCKYHESSTNFTPSMIYKPLLQMLTHFCEYPTANIRYILFAHFPNETGTNTTVGKVELEGALKSRDKDLQKYITRLPSSINLDRFIAKFEMQFGMSYGDLVVEVNRALRASGFSVDDIDILTYPNAIQKIADISTQHDPAKRQVKRKDFLDVLKAIRATAISKWTMALCSRKKLIEARRKQLKAHLDINARFRHLVVDPESIEDYDDEIVLFISEFIKKYHYKPAHICTPVLCIFASYEDMQEIRHRLYKKRIDTNDGYIGLHFEEDAFFRDPINGRDVNGNIDREFALRIINRDHYLNVFNSRKCDDLFLLGDISCDSLDTVDVNVERLTGVTFKEIKYVMGVSNVYE
ncbi:MAG TPA: hypothetical protein VHV83_14350 [Armatimonadota bacterium]|nr:hypothetical protein [Armatimonadota bacterium]